MLQHLSCRLVYQEVALPRGSHMVKKNLQPSHFLNRELGLLEFNRRVLAQAADDSVPLLERLRFLTIVSSNLDEFFEIRVAGLKEQIKRGHHGVRAPTAAARRRSIELVSAQARALVGEQYRLLNNVLLPALAKQGVIFPRREDWTEAQRTWIRDYFMRELLPVLTPIGLDPAHPFPRVLNKSLNLAVELEGRDAFGRKSRDAIVQAPRALPRVIRLPADVAGARIRLRVPLLDPARARGRAVLRHEGEGLLPVPRHAQLRPVRRRGGDQEPAHRHAGRAAAAPLRRRGAPGGRRQLLAADRGFPAAAVRPVRIGPVPRRRPGEPVPAARGDRPGRPARPEVPGVPARAAAGAGRPEGHLRGAEEAGRAAAPSLRVLHPGDRFHPHLGRPIRA